jgi:kinase
MKPVKTEKAGADLLPKEMNGMTISDDKVDGHNDKVSISFTHSLLTS